MAYRAIPDSFPVLRAPGLILREFGPGDREAWYRRLTDPASLALTADEPVTSRERITTLIRGMHEGFIEKELIRWAIELEETGDSVGSCGFNVFNERDRRAEIGYALNREWWGHGIMPRAAAAVIGYGFDVLDLRRIDASVVGGNERSCRVLEKLGFRHEGTRREYRLVQGEPRDFHIYGLLRREWSGLPGAEG